MDPSTTSLPSQSAISTLLDSSNLQSDPDHASHHLALAHQVLHNLQHQHMWTCLKIVSHSPLPPHNPLPRPLLSGIPPTRLYVHPDEQIELLKREAERKKVNAGTQRQLGSKEAGVLKGSTGQAETTTVDQGDEKVTLSPEPEWVLPTALRETWSLRRLAAIFDAITAIPAVTPTSTGLDAHTQLSEAQLSKASKWRELKRVVLAAVDDDSSIVYYIVHDGIVKPRQN